MKFFIKYIIKQFLYFILHIFYVFPVKNNRIIFESFNGKQISDNPFYIWKLLKENNSQLDFIWVVGKDIFLFDDFKDKTVVFHSLRYILAMMTSKFIVNNTGFSTYIPFRKNQILINTWHGGGAYKRVGCENVAEKKALYFSILKKDVFNIAKTTSVFISSSKKFTDVMTESNFIPREKYLGIGMPRNDIFFNSIEVQKENGKVRSKLDLKKDDFVVLYAPTYRGAVSSPQEDSNNIDILKLKSVCENKFGKKTIVLFRGHYSLIYKLDFSLFDKNVSSYPNMQELLCMADMLITDYSSSMWDFSFTNKPGFLFVPDLDKYQNERGFYTPIETWPFAFAKTNEGLAKQIMEWTPEFQAEKNKKHHELLGSFEDGHATERICEVIENELENI
ncbi:CDP-glycerol glycerophosphotransferase family protein [uncultured Treponema sp.]|uniref:CDP-glycerol glycerophosphotransferase family protein n=1 Tax=uncultured Treponema sp. TaxID=162155 RepID=UPI0025DF8DA6|nr:CDP-glycerol glycerophosphotransferase family protein [uncultured Treponema sp.]